MNVGSVLFWLYLHIVLLKHSAKKSNESNCGTLNIHASRFLACGTTFQRDHYRNQSHHHHQIKASIITCIVIVIIIINTIIAASSPYPLVICLYVFFWSYIHILYIYCFLMQKFCHPLCPVAWGLGCLWMLFWMCHPVQSVLSSSQGSFAWLGYVCVAVWGLGCMETKVDVDSIRHRLSWPHSSYTYVFMS